MNAPGRKIPRSPIRLVLRGARYLATRIMIALSPSRTAHGIRIVNLATQEDTEELLGSASAAVELIARYDQVRMRQVERFLKRILVVFQPGSEYWPFAGACALSEHTVNTQSTEWVASIIVHEAVHARLWLKGLGYAPSIRDRIEVVCADAQIAFLKRVPGTEALVEHIYEQLLSGWYSDEEIARRRVVKLRALGAPQWLINRFEAPPMISPEAVEERERGTG